MEIVNAYLINNLNEGCISISLSNSSCRAISFDRLRQEFENGRFSSLRSVDFVLLKNRKIILIEVTDLRATVNSLKKSIKKEENVPLSRDSYILKELIKAEYREKLFESLLLLCHVGVYDQSQDNIKFFIVLCDIDIRSIHSFHYLKSFISSIIPSSWECKVIHHSSLLRVLRRLC